MRTGLAITVGWLVLLAGLALDGGLRRHRPDDATLLHWATGRQIARTREVPARDPFTFTAARQRWVNPGWCGDVVAWAAYRSGGLALCDLLGLEVALATIALVLARARTRSRSAVVALAVAALSVRPLTAGSLAGPDAWGPFVVALGLLLADRPGARPALALGATIATGSHLHPFGSLLLVIPGADALSEALGLLVTGERSGRGRWALLALGLGALGAALDPAGLAAPAHAFGCVADPRFRACVAEAETTSAPLVALAPWLLLVLGASLAAQRPVTLAEALRVVVAAALAGTSRSFLPVFVVVASGRLASSLDALCERLPSLAAIEPHSRRATRLAPVALLATFGVALGLRGAVLQRGRSGQLDGLVPPDLARAVRFLAEEPSSRRLFHHFAMGGALAFALGEGRGAFVDERLDLAARSGAFEDMLAVALLEPSFERRLRARGCERALLPRGCAPEDVLRALSWRPVFEDRSYVVLAAPPGAGP